ncbi:MAG: divergent polysaccharide deacetylase family protein [Pseudomonadota bacterium]
MKRRLLPVMTFWLGVCLGSTAVAEDDLGVAYSLRSAEPIVEPELRLAIVMDDLGYHPMLDQQIINWPYPMTLAVLPGAPNASSVGHAAQAAGKEVILHQPMQPYRHGLLEPGNLTEEMSGSEFELTLTDNLAAVPHTVGLNNHTGSRLTEDPASMHRLMQHLQQQGLYFLDSRTTPNTVAHRIAEEWGVPTISRDVFLDHIRTPAAVEREFKRALKLVQQNGHAVLIAHPNALSVSYLERALGTLPEHIRLVTISELVATD